MADTPLQRFLKLSGYIEADVTGQNQKARRFTTSNGGKYVLSPNGRAIRTLLGPPPPKEASEE